MQNVIDKVQNRISSWKAKVMSFCGWLTLVKSVIGSLPLYFFSLFKAPTSVIDYIEKLRRQFLWGDNEVKHNINWVAWKCVLGPKAEGGLGISTLRSVNISLLTKWL